MNNGKIKIDLYIHTKCSRDCFLSFKKNIKVCNNKGVNCVIVTDHNTIEGALRLQKASFKVLVGEEVMTDQREITALFLKEQILPCLSSEETIARIKAQGGLVYVPHPITRFRKSTIKVDRLEKIWREVDVIEVFDSRNIFSKDLVAWAPFVSNLYHAFVLVFFYRKKRGYEGC